VLGVTDLRARTKTVIAELGNEPVMVLSRSKPVAVLLGPDGYEALLDRIDELSAAVSVLASKDEDSVPLEAAMKELADNT
jgi:PHD/YefM family antitoxin component YafN of YafNO toxin-antitoxin module